MNPERWQQVEKLYHSALEREPAQRAAFLAEACQDDDQLRREVEWLIGHGETADPPLDGPVMETNPAPLHT